MNYGFVHDTEKITKYESFIVFQISADHDLIILELFLIEYYYYFFLISQSMSFRS